MQNLRWSFCKTRKLLFTYHQSLEQELIDCANNIQSIAKTNRELDPSIGISLNSSMKESILKRTKCSPNQGIRHSKRKFLNMEQ